MNISVRINGALAQQIGTTRLRVQVADTATVQDVLDALHGRYPDSAEILNLAIPFVAGSHLSPSAILKQGQEVALLMPAAGG